MNEDGTKNNKMDNFLKLFLLGNQTNMKFKSTKISKNELKKKNIFLYFLIGNKGVGRKLLITLHPIK